MIDLLLPAASAALLMTAALSARQVRLPGHRDLALCLAAGAAWFLFQADTRQFQILLPVLFTGPILCNRAFRAAFDMRRDPAWLDAVLAALLVLEGGLGYVWPHLGWAARGFDMLSLFLFADATLVVWRGLPDDLVEARRHLRLWLLVLGAGISLAVSLAATFGYGHLAACVGAVAVLGLCLTAAAFGPQLLAPITQAAPAVPRPLDDREQKLLTRLRTVMSAENLYRDPGLTLSRLARRLDIPEHRLRKVIHAGEGDGHFSTYVARWRLAEIKGHFDDPARDGDTLLSLAVEAGYSSLSAFNRAFRMAEGTTPSLYRAARKAARTANTTAATTARADGTSAA